MSARFQGLVNPATGRVLWNEQSSSVRPGDAIDFRGMAITPDGQVYVIADTGQARVFQDGIAIEAATGMVLFKETAVANISMGGLGVNVDGSICAANPPDVIHQGVALTNAGALSYDPAELLQNGTFDTDTAGWAARPLATLSWEAQKAKANITGTGGGIQSDQTIPALTIGKQYTVQWDVIGISGGYAGNFGMFDSTGQIDNLQEVTVVVDTTVTFVQTFTATGTSIAIEINRRDASTGDVYFDNISLKEA